MKRKKDKGRIDGPFVALLKDTMAAPAWRAMSPQARVLFIALKARYSFTLKNNGRIYLSLRQAADETGLDKDQVAHCFRELQYYGFVAQTEPGCLGVNGKGKAPHWRLTELGYMLDPPTREFRRWDGAKFHEQRRPKRHRDQARRLAELRAATATKKSRIPSGPYRHPVWPIQTPLSGPSGQLSDKLSGPYRHTDESDCLAHTDISRLTICGAQKRRGKRKPKAGSDA
jgi:hypothetical protein